jgi:hypothetical protein
MSRQKRLNKKILQEDREAFAALQAIEDYNPSNKDFELAKVTDSHQEMVTDQTDEVQKHAVANASSDKATDSERGFHNNILGAKNQVKAQYGENSDEYASLGMKKKDEYKRGRRTASNNAGNKS